MPLPFEPGSLYNQKSELATADAAFENGNVRRLEKKVDKSHRLPRL
jgi:hypothetical protein